MKAIHIPTVCILITAILFISHRWSSAYKPEAFDGLVVVAGISRENVPQVGGDTMVHQVNYATFLEHCLIHLLRSDSRMRNSDLESGGSSSPHAIGAVYVAFKRHGAR